MRRIRRTVLLIALLAPVLAGCADFDMDKLDVFGLNEKKKLPGARKDVFPGGVPGVSQGIPPEYVKGYQPPPDTPPETAVAPDTAEGPEKKVAVVPPPEAVKPKPKRKPKPPVQPAQQNQQQPAAQQQAAPAQQGWPAPAPNSNPAWQQASPPAGTFSR